MKTRGIVVLLAVMLLVVIPVAQVHAQSSGPLYIVQEGDTLYSIAIRFGTSVDEILAVNPQVDPALLYPGMEIIIPGFDGVTGSLVTSSVQAGQTLELLAETYGLAQSDVILLNRILNPERLYIGQDLVLAESSETVSLQPFVYGAGSSLLAAAAGQGQNAWLLAGYLDNQHLWAVPGTIGRYPADAGRPFPEPLLEVLVLPEAVYQGRTLEIQLHTAVEVIAEGQFGSSALNFVPFEPQKYIALQGVDAMAEPGLETLRVQLYNAADFSPLYGFQQPVRIRNAGYGSDPVLTVPAESVDPVTTQAEADAVALAVSAVTQQKGWDANLTFPSAYTESFPAYFGSRRNYNDMGYNSYHTGLDLFGNKDTQVTAPANGTVVMVQTLPARGQAIYIDHGWGVYTGYGHLSQVFVAEGDQVTLGQVIAMVGNTGRVTGPHLHWEVVVGGVPVDPLEWVERVFPGSG